MRRRRKDAANNVGISEVQAAGLPPRQRFLLALLCLGILAIYLLWPTQNYYWDGIGFAQTIEDASSLNPSLLHPNHLIYTAAGYLEYRLLRAAGLTMRSLTVLQWTNMLLSTAAAYLLFTMLLECGGSLYLSTSLTLLFSFSATWWKFSTDANSYVPSVFFLLLGCRWLLPRRSSRPVALALAHTLAMLFHQLAALFFPAAVCGLFLQNRSSGRRQTVSAVLQYSGIAFACTLAAYFAGFHWQQQSLDWVAFLRWLTAHSPEVSFSFDPWANTVYSLRGHVRLLLGGRIAAVLGQREPATMALSLVSLALVSVWVFQTFRHRAGWGRRRVAECAANARQRPLLGLLSVWVAAYLVFLFFWLPGNTFYRLFYFPALVLLGGLLLASWEGRGETARKSRLGLLAAAVAVFNLAFYIIPNSRVESNPPLDFALRMRRVWNRETLIYYREFNTDNWTIRYFNPETSWKLLDANRLPELEAELQQGEAGGEAAWLDTTAWEQLGSLPEGAHWLSEHAVPDAYEERLDTGHRIRFQKIRPR